MKIKNILLIDDSEIDNFINKSVLEKANMVENIIAKTSAKEALEYLSNTENEFPNIIFLDIRMPEMDGFETTACIRSHTDPTIRLLPIIAMTASVTQSEIDRCFEAGMNEYVPKPFDADDLILKIGQLMEAREIPKKEIKHN